MIMTKKNYDNNNKYQSHRKSHTTIENLVHHENPKSSSNSQAFILLDALRFKQFWLRLVVLGMGWDDVRGRVPRLAFILHYYTAQMSKLHGVVIVYYT